jgi:putative heme transporter
LNRGWKALSIAMGIALAALAVRFSLHFPWSASVRALAGTDLLLLLVATLINFLSVVAKGWGWHLLLRPAAPHRWKVAQEATLVGAAVNCLAVSVGGEAARVGYITTRAPVTAAAAVTAIVASRAAEALALVVFVALACGIAPPPSWPPALRILLGLAAAGIVAGTLLGAWAPWLRRAPGWARRFLQPLADAGPGAIAGSLALAVVAWAAEWATFHLSIRATHISIPATVSLTALIAANAGGVIRLTPGNVGVLQASLVLALVPFGVPAPEAIAAGLALQAVQTLPTVAAGAAIAGVRSLGRLTGRPLAAGS